MPAELLGGASVSLREMDEENALLLDDDVDTMHVADDGDLLPDLAIVRCRVDLNDMVEGSL